MLVLMLWQWSGPEWGTWGTAAWSPRRLWMWRRCSSLRWSTFPNKHTPSTTRPPACVPLCPLGKSISSWVMRMRRRPGWSSGMWQEGWRVIFLLISKSPLLVFRLLLIDSSIAQKWKDKMNRKIKVSIKYRSVTRLNALEHTSHESLGGMTQWFRPHNWNSHVCVRRFLNHAVVLHAFSCPVFVQRWDQILQKRGQTSSRQSRHWDLTLTCVHVGVHVDIAL